MKSPQESRSDRLTWNFPWTFSSDPFHTLLSPLLPPSSNPLCLGLPCSFSRGSLLPLCSTLSSSTSACPVQSSPVHPSSPAIVHRGGEGQCGASMDNLLSPSSAAEKPVGFGASSSVRAADGDVFEDSCSICLEPFTAEDPSTV